ncbi:DUF881 domain-containing protein [Blastococcus sp. TF02A-26]|uniref:DUF881 domain-containing protein n=1 Tax=Blastococcus sp. TF02A-26 TaxID=2250577 RepID=UPI000DE94166|nr:DUF881 domain-containing protein [Blastococcus sp. TF02A-26]RBY84709.1 hypothetical protein DQ240_13790 [Blastococcus sp. TF02A-26]
MSGDPRPEETPEGAPATPPAEPAVAADDTPAPADDPTPPADPTPGAGPAPRRRRDPMAAALIGVLTLLLGFAFAVQVRVTDTEQALTGAREEDLVRILDELESEEARLRAQLADQRAALRDLSDSDSRADAALEEAQRRADALAILNGTVAAEGPGLLMTIRDPEDEVRVADLLGAIQELRGAGAETMQVDGVRIGVTSAVTGSPGDLGIDGQEISTPFEIVVIGSPQDLETAMNIPGGVVDTVNRRGGSVVIAQAERVLVDALRPLETPQYAEPD